jgi:hypothetical protein
MKENTSPKRKNKATRYRRRGVERAAAELAVLAMAKDVGETIQIHRDIASARLAAAKNQRRQRSEEELEVLSLARVLGLLAKQYPRYADHLNVPRNRLLKRLTRPAARRAEIRACVEREEQIDIEGLVQCTLYDPPVVRSDVKVMIRGGQLQAAGALPNTYELAGQPREGKPGRGGIRSLLGAGPFSKRDARR